MTVMHQAPRISYLKKKKECSYLLPTATEWIPLEVFGFVVIEHQTYKFMFLSQVRF